MNELYETERIEGEIGVEELLAGYFNGEYYEALCRKCPNYGRLWSCPPYDFQPRAYLEGYARVKLFATKILISPQVREETITKEGIAEVIEAVIAEAKEAVDAELLALEREKEGRRMLSSGGCRLCTKCARPDGMPCRQRGRMRYSLESLGCNVTRLAEDRLGIRLLWAGEKLPEYIVLVNAILEK